MIEFENKKNIDITQEETKSVSEAQIRNKKATQ